MKRLTRLIVPLIIAQAGCLALGLWLQDRFLLSISTWQAKAQILEANGEDEAEAMADAGDAPIEVGGKLLADNLLKSLLPVRVLAFVWIIGLQAVAAYLIVSRANSDHIQQQRMRREESLHKSRELIQTRDAIVFGLAKLAESRDPETGQHLERIAMYSTRLAAALRNDPMYRGQVSSSFVKLIGISSALHDIGKVGIEDRVLLKPGKLTKEERKHIQIHAAKGGDCIREIEQRLGNSNFLEMAREIAYCHHERWDGRGYAKGLKGEEIPLAARIVSIADVYDALRSKRVYKDAMTHKECVEIISGEAGKQFDPNLVAVFLKISEQFKDISMRFSDEAIARRGNEAKAQQQARDQISTLQQCVNSLTEDEMFIESVS